MFNNEIFIEHKILVVIKASQWPYDRSSTPSLDDMQLRYYATRSHYYLGIGSIVDLSKCANAF